MHLPYRVGMKMRVAPGKLFPHLYHFFKEEIHGGEITEISRGTAKIIINDSEHIYHNRKVYFMMEIPIDDITEIEVAKHSKRKQENN